MHMDIGTVGILDNKVSYNVFPLPRGKLSS